MKLIIEYINGPNKGNKQEFVKETINIGSADNNDIVIKDSQLVSPNHALIQLKEDRVIIFNHSSNGTFVNDTPVNKAKLPNKGVITFGQNGPVLGFQIIQDEATLPKPVPDSAMATQRRWYDRNSLISKAMEILKNTEDYKATQVTQALINILEKQDPNAIYVRSDVNIDEVIKSLPRESRWYDLNKLVQKVIESLRLCNPEMQEALALQIIIFLETNDLNKIEKLSFPTNLSGSNNHSSQEKLNISSKEQNNLMRSDNLIKKCPKCNTNNEYMAVFCINCGLRIYKDTENMLDENEIHCHDCGEKIKINAEICPKCGFKQIGFQENLNGINQNKEFDNSKYCLECGEKIRSNAEICPKCGVRQNKEEANKVIAFLFCFFLGCLYNELGFLDRKNDRQFPFKRQKIKQKGKRYVKKVQDLYPGIQGKSSKRVA